MSNDDEYDVDTAAAAHRRISKENLRRTSEIGVVGGQELDESDFDSRFLSTTTLESSSLSMKAEGATTTTTSNGSNHLGPPPIIHSENDESNENNDFGNDRDGGEDDQFKRRSSTGGGRIKFSRKKLYGRDKHLELLHKIYNKEQREKKTNNNNNTSYLKVVHVTGYSGSGKSALVSEFIQQLKQQHQAPLYIMHGKYEEPVIQKHSFCTVPYKGISDALKGWYSSLNEKEKESLASYMQTNFLDVVGDDAHVLVDIVPNLKRLIIVSPEGEVGGGTAENGKGNINGNNIFSSSEFSCASSGSKVLDRSKRTQNTADDPINKSRIHFVFQSFFQCLCQANGSKEEEERESSLLPSTIFFFDNMQWADVYTLDLLRSILSDQSSACNSMVILTSRSNEIEGDDHPFNTRLLHPIQKGRTEGGNDTDDESGIHTMQVTNLDQSDIGEFIADTLLLQEEEVTSLTAAIYKRTMGNIFFTMQAMEQLHRQNALYYDMVLFQWKWVQLSQEQLEDQLSKDIVEMVRSKIKCLSIDTQHALSVFAHTRSTLDADTLWELFNATYSSSSEHVRISDDKSGLLKFLNEAVAEGLLMTNTRMNSNKSTVEYSFVHDRIREAARSFWVGDTLHENLFRIGNALVLRGKDYYVGEDWMLITAVQHLNNIPFQFHDEMGKLGLARLNLETAKLSMDRAAFEDAVNYAENGIRCLPQNRWDAHGVLSHELYALAAESSRVVGRLTQMERYCTTCLTAEKGHPQETKCDIYYTFASGLLYGSNRLKEAKEIVLDVLKHLGCSFPKSAIGSKAKTLSKLIRLVMTKRKRKVGDVEKMSFMTNGIVIKAMKFLDLLLFICYLTNDEVLTPLITFKALEYTLDYGVSIFSPRLIAAIGFIFTGALNSLQDGVAHAKYSLRIMEKVDHRPIEPGTLMVVYACGFHWLTPSIKCVPPLRKGYEVGMKTGKVEEACWCMILLQGLLFQSGIPLPAVEAEMKQYIPKMEDLGQRMIALMARSMWNTVLGLMDSTDSRVEFRMSELLENQMLKATVDANRRSELAYLGDYEQCANSAVKDANRTLRALPGNPTPPFEMFLNALSCLEMARQKPDKPEYLRSAKRIRKWVVSWAKQGSPNFQHRRALLDAEFAAIQRQDKLALQKFDLAVDLALKGKFTNDAAVANERWGTFALEVLGDDAEGKCRLTDAVALCTKWGAVSKIRRLKERFPEVF